MLNLFREGGFPMYFLAAFGLATLVFAGRFAWAPVRRMLRTTIWLGLATAFTSLTGMCAALAMVGHHAPSYAKAHPELSMLEVLLQGVAEALSAGIFGFTMLSLASLLVALGFHREVID
jgi:hypothetical protein